jgi:hypothetical protein
VAVGPNLATLHSVRYYGATRKYGEPQEVGTQRPRRATRHVGIEKQPTKLFPRAQDFPQPIPAPTAIADGQVKQLKRPCQSPIEPVGPVRLPCGDRAIDLAPNVAELLGERKRSPASLSEASVGRHHCSSAFHEPVDNLADAIPENIIVHTPRAISL